MYGKRPTPRMLAASIRRRIEKGGDFHQLASELTTAKTFALAFGHADAVPLIDELHGEVMRAWKKEAGLLETAG